MNKQKLISVLQSRIAKRRNSLGGCWEYWHTLCNMDYLDAYIKVKAYAVRLGLEQKEDKAILKQLVGDERELKLLRECAKKLQGRIDTLLGWNKQER